MPTEVNQDTTMYKGKDYTVKFTETDAEDLSAFNEITYAFADSATATSAHFTKTQSSGGITTSGSSNEVAEVTVNGTDIDSLTTGRSYYHELVTEDGSGNEQVAAEGKVFLKPTQTDN